MTELLCATDSYIRHFEARVVRVQPETGGVALDRTAFFPGGGGQPCDVGRLVWEGGEAGVVRLNRADGEVWHILEGALPAEGAAVVGHLDWERRYQLMRTHTALHILCGVVWRDYRAQVTGGNMEPLRGRLDFEFESLHHEMVQEIEERINAEVGAAREVRVQTLPRDVAFQIPDLIRTKINLLPPAITEVRTVEIVGLDLQADGGTHVANTREVGHVRVVDYRSKGRINKRIEIALDPSLSTSAEE
jgi:misacylated tRNA(Ala) deacylase